MTSLELPAAVFAVLVVTWGVVLVRVRLAGRSLRGRAAALAFLCFATSATLVVRELRYAFDRFFGVPDLAILVASGTTIAGIASAVGFGLVVSGTKVRGVRRTWVVLAVVAAVEVSAFLLIPRRLDRPDFGYWQPTHPATIVFHLVNITCLTVAVVIGAVALHPLRRRTRGPLRVAVFLLWLSFLSFIGYAGCRYWYVIAYGFGFVPQGTRYATYGLVTEMAMALGVLLLALGGLVQAGANAVRWGRRLRGYRRIGPLWTELTGAVPEVVLGAVPRWFAGSLELRLYRRTVEIRDAQLELSGRVSPDRRACAGSILEEAGVTDPLALDACVLRIGLASPRALHPAETSAWSAASDLDDELAALLALDRALRDPVVAAAAERSLTPL
ncbi:hypothetical protein SAMN05216188_108182 [Lentzea xinjiangensis]|uniref:DUF6545 domain-containing protein n=1 Tax=Lentzea xinjiangensis TaxID=402600 RepID=A0A1H9LZS4_9PSEU|nr:MAB_1171c family putative transporter [Lentzea xinjiangensis]SER16921.1 hypothetical protein SAMN05216188_108182 [Lentzea xinjiangensis]